MNRNVPAKKIRVHELAKELGMTNSEVLDLAGAAGVAAKAPSSSLQEAYADMLRRRAEREGLTRDEQPEEARGGQAAQRPHRCLRLGFDRIATMSALVTRIR